MIRMLAIAAGFIAATITSEAHAQAPVCSTPATTAALTTQIEAAASEIAQNRVAIVVGNAVYGASAGVSNLPNAANDARTVADVAHYADYLTFCFQNLSGAQLLELARLMDVHAPGSAEGVSANDKSHLFFYFAGHGFQYNSETYIVPANYSVTNGQAINSAVNLRLLLRRFRAGADFLIAAIDACRGPAPTGVAGAQTLPIGNGPTAPTALGAGLLVQFSSAPGHLAADQGAAPGYGAYAPNFVELAEMPGLLMGLVFLKTKSRTTQTSGQVQIPQTSDNLWDDARTFHPALTSAEENFATAWIAQNGSAQPRPCVRAVVNDLPNLEEDLRSVPNADARFRQVFESFLAPIRRCVRDQTQRPNAVALEAENAVSLDTGIGRVGVSARSFFVWSPLFARDDNVLTVQALDPTRGFRGTGDADPSNFIVRDAPYQRAVTLSDASAILQASANMEHPVLFTPSPQTREDVRAIVRLQRDINLAALRSGVPGVEIEIVDDTSAIARVIARGREGVLSDQAALVAAIANAVQAAAPR